MKKINYRQYYYNGDYKLPDVDDLFESKGEFVNYLNKLYSAYYDEIE